MFARIGTFALWFLALGILVAGVWFGRSRLIKPGTDIKSAEKSIAEQIAAGTQPAKLSIQAQKNLALKSKPLTATTYWRTLDLPGVIVDRPGISNRGVVAPVTGIVTSIFHYPGDTVEPNASLFSLRLVSESLHASQLELFKATREIEIAQQQLKRLSEVGQSGALPQSRLIEIENQIRRLDTTVQAYQQDLQARGLSPESIAAASRGGFVTEIVVRAPGEQALKFTDVALASAQEPTPEPNRLPFKFELQDLKVELGEQVNAGEVLCELADHRSLLIEGRGFKEDMPLIQEAARKGSEIEVEYEVAVGSRWPESPKHQHIHHVANTVDRETRTFGFYLPLENQWSAYTHDGKTRLQWRFRPGDRVRLHARVEKFENVFVLPQAALVREGPEAFVFQQNGELFNRRGVHVLHEDRRQVVIANDGSLRSGQYIAQSGAASINRVMKAQAASGQPTGVHVHADGSVHGAH
jgi:cobalt-zinc-cadmium efflux system membrane fusion protein